MPVPRADVRARFELTQVPVVDHSSVAPDAEQALEELKLYSVHHPRQLPIVFLLEIKRDWMMLDPALPPVGTAELRALDQHIEGKLSDRLHRPRDLLEATHEGRYGTTMKTRGSHLRSSG